MRTIQLTCALCFLAILGGVALPSDAEGATITASYEAGYRDTILNDYGAPGMGTFRLVNGADAQVALCVEAADPHASGQDAYSLVPNRIDSQELDALVWVIDRAGALDNDTAIAAASLAWYYSGAVRDIGPLVWSNGAQNFAPITPLAPEPWDKLPRFSLSHPVGLRAGGLNLDAAERRVAELHRQVTALRGPWTLTADPTGKRFRLVGESGPIPGQAVQVEVRNPTGSTVASQALTDSDGWATTAVPNTPDGAIVTASVDSPGIHKEWDGAGRVQRMATSTTSVLTATFSIPALPRHIEVHKSSTDPTIGVADGEFVLIDANGNEVGRSTSNSSGVARFSPINPQVHPAPYTIHELEAPPGLDRSAPDVGLATVSHDPNSPTIVDMLDRPLTVPVRVRKELSIPTAGPQDRSGFEFSVVRRSDKATVVLVTGPDRLTDRANLGLGTYEVCETAKPAWASGLIDGGCQPIEIKLSDLSTAEILIPYLNIVPTPTIDTRAADVADDDQVMSTAGGTAVDHVELTNLVPGTEYTLVGELVAVEAGIGTSTGITASTRFVADQSTERVVVRFEIPAVAAGAIVITERVEVDGQVLVEHADLADPNQTLTIVAPPPVTTTTTTTTTLSPATTSPPGVPTTTTTTTTTAPTPTLPIATHPTLPPTGGDGATRLMRLGDIGFVSGVALIALASLLPRRNGSRTRNDGAQ